MQTQIRVRPLKSGDSSSTTFSLKKSLAHDLRKYHADHIDSDRAEKNLLSKGFTEFSAMERLAAIKNKYGMVCKTSTIDVASYVFTVNDAFFDTQEKKQTFFDQARKFLERECGEDSILGLIGHDDESGFHVHAYAVPLHETKFKNRFGENVKTVINFRGKYSHSKQELMEYRKNHMSDKTKTGELQTRWAEFIQQVFPELERGKRNSERRHITPKEYRKMIQTAEVELDNSIKEKKLQEEELTEKISATKKYLLELQAKVKSLNMERYKIACELSEAEKARQNEFRKISIKELAKIFGRKSFPASVRTEDGKLRKIANAFDYLMYIEGLTFTGAIKFLHENFSSDRTFPTVNDALKEVTAKPKYLTVKEDLIRRQMKALGNIPVRITLQKKEVVEKDGKLVEQDRAIVLTGLNQEEEFFVNTDQLVDQIKTLNRFNAEGWNVFITPIEYEAGDSFIKKFPIVVDDVKDIAKLKREFGDPNLILETSAQNYQAIYVLDNLIDYTRSKNSIKKQRQLYNDLFLGLNRRYGDPRISGLRHGFRLAGYANQKPGRGNTFVRIIESNPNPPLMLQNSIRLELEKLLQQTSGGPRKPSGELKEETLASAKPTPKPRPGVK